jgi:hypothetical protein
LEKPVEEPPTIGMGEKFMNFLDGIFSDEELN